MDVTRATEEAIKIGLALAGLILALLWPRLSRRLLTAVLVVLTSVAALNYARFGPKKLSAIDTYDLMHYYLSARYFKELGYFGLYPAALLADHEHGPYNRKIRSFRYQDEEHGYQLRRVSFGVERGRQIRERNFTPERWQAFESDFICLQRRGGLSRSRWHDFITDRGFNGTPVWVLIATPFARLVPAQAIRLVCLIDVVWLVVALVVVGRAYGSLTSVWCLFFLLTTYSWRCAVPSQVFLRHDWLCALMIAMALVKRGRPFWAGAFTGLAGLLRFFPAA